MLRLVNLVQPCWLEGVVDEQGVKNTCRAAGGGGLSASDPSYGWACARRDGRQGGGYGVRGGLYALYAQVTA